MGRKTIAQIRAELDELNALMAKKQRGSDTQIIKANARQTQEYKNKLSRALKGRVRSAEEIDKWRKSYNGAGENNSMYGKQHTDATKLQISKNRRGKVGRVGPHSEETKKKMRKPRNEESKINMRKPRSKKICPHCGFEGGGGTMLRWHFDYCKHKK